VALATACNPIAAGTVAGKIRITRACLGQPRPVHQVYRAGLWREARQRGVWHVRRHIRLPLAALPSSERPLQQFPYLHRLKVACHGSPQHSVMDTDIPVSVHWAIRMSQGWQQRVARSPCRGQPVGRTSNAQHGRVRALPPGKVVGHVLPRQPLHLRTPTMRPSAPAVAREALPCLHAGDVRVCRFKMQGSYLRRGGCAREHAVTPI
jgi:hypothetical protein